MRVVVAPDKFAGTLTALQAAMAIAEGWRSSASTVEIDLVPVSDGGPGFVEVLHAALGGDLLTFTVTGPLGAPVDARLLRVDGPGGRAYVEAAQACGLHLVPTERRDPTTTTTYGVGELAAVAVGTGATEIVFGLGGSATNDGGAGMLAALGAEPLETLRRGGLALRELSRVDLAGARARMRGARVLAATDVDSPLLGPHGATCVFGPQKGATPEQVEALERALARWAQLTDPELATAPGAGAAGGLGFALLLLGGTVESGIEAVLDAVRMRERIAGADLVVTGEGAFDSSSLRGKAPYGVARLAARAGVPCVVLAGRVGVTHEEMAQAGIVEAHAVVDSAGSSATAFSDPEGELRKLAARVAAAWAAGCGNRS